MKTLCFATCLNLYKNLENLKGFTVFYYVIMRKQILLIFGLSLVSLGIVSISAEPNTIPDWVKNNAKWWAEGQIGESDYISSLQFLINQDILKIPITEVVATNVNLEDKDRAMSFVVHFSDAEFAETLTIYTFSTFFHFSTSIGSTQLDATSGLETVPAFSLQSLPSKDKSQLYKLVNDYVNAGRDPEPFAVKVDVMSGDGKIIQSWQYRFCNVNDYTTFVDSNKEEYRFSDTDDLEIRELIVFACRGFSLE